MKKFCILLSCFFTFELSAQIFPAKDLFYTVPLNTQADYPVHSEWWHEYMEVPQHNAFLQSILDLVDSGRVVVYSPEFPFDKMLTKEEIHLLLHKTDTLYTDYGYLMDGDGYYLERHSLTSSDIVSISFHEEWQYDSIGKTLRKNVKGITLNSPRFATYDYPQGQALFYIPFDGKGIKSGAAISNPPMISGFTYDFHTADFNHVVYSSEVLFGGDSTMQKKNQAETNLILHSIIKGKKIIFYDTIYPYNKPIDKKIAKSKLPIYQSTNAMRFLEDWIVDLNKMSFTKTVHGIVLEKQNESVVDGENRVSFSRLAFLPLNGFVPAPIIFSNQTIASNFLYRETFFDSPLVYDDQTIFTDSAKLMGLCIGICNLAESQKLPSYRYESDLVKTRDYFSKKITDSLFSEVHKKNIDPNIFRELSFDQTPFYYQSTGGLGFKENWSYNSYQQIFSKDIQTLTLTSLQYVGYKEADFILPLFSVDPPRITDTAGIMKPEFLVAKNIQSPVSINHSWEIEESERSNDPQAFKNENVLGPSARYHLIQQIINDALSGKITAYDGVKTEAALTPMQLRTKIDSLKDSTFVPIDLPTDYLLFQEVVFVEDWYFNPSNGEFYKKVNSIIFVNTENLIGPYYIDFESQKRVFCIKLN